MKIHIRVVYCNLFGPCSLTAWVDEENINQALESREIPRNAMVWLDKGDRFDRYMGYQQEQAAKGIA